MVHMDQGPAQGNSMTGPLNVDSPNQTEQQQAQSQFGRDILSIQDPMAGIEGQSINVEQPVTTDTSVATNGVQGVSINQAALEAGEAAFNSVLNFANQNGVDSAVAHQIASAAREHARHIATSVGGQEETKLERSNRTEADELAEIDKKMQDAMQELELELMELEQRNALDPALSTIDESGLSEYEKNRLVIAGALEGLQETAEELNIYQSLRAASTEAREQARENLLSYADQEDLIRTMVLEQAADLFEKMAQEDVSTQQEQTGLDSYIMEAALLDQFTEGIQTIHEGLVEAAETAAREQQERIEAQKERLKAAYPGLADRLEDPGIDTAMEIFTALQDHLAEEKLELQESLENAAAAHRTQESSRYTTVA